ncbi:hypothetical protein [Actinokineospora sp.]|uniref:hypothetical protein n=1 Tax=Actinokineospora sp. TaxID=1872133 RepID=UPI004037D00B
MTASAMTARNSALRRLAILLSMDCGVVVLFRHNRVSKKQTCIWGQGPSVDEMQRAARRYLGKITGLELSEVEGARSAVLLDAVNRPKNRRGMYGAEGGEFG